LTQLKEEGLNNSKPYYSNILVNIPHLRNKISISLAFSAAILMLLTTTATTSPLLLFNVIPVQAQTTPLSFRTTEPASGSDSDCLAADATLTFDAQGTPSSSNPQVLDITSGTFKVTASDDEQKTYSGNIASGSFTSNSGGGILKFAFSGTIDNASNTTNCSIEGATFSIGAPCSTSNDGGASNPVSISTHYIAQAPVFNNFNGVVECSQGGGDTTTQSSSSSSSSMTGTTQDGDGDGILDANDNCPNLTHTSCYKEGDTAVVVHSNG
jgi:hypothetical protein